MALGLLTIPFLIRYLGGSGFAAWALLLALAAGFSLLELGLGLPSTLLRFLTGPADQRECADIREVFGCFWLLLAVSFALASLVVLGIAEPLAKWLRLPATPPFSAAALIYLVFAAVAVRAFLKTATLVLFAAEKFVAVSVTSMALSLCSNLAAIVAAWQSGRLDLTLVAFWSTQLVVLGIVFIVTRGMALPLFRRTTLGIRRLREIIVYSAANQMDGLAHFVNFQFDKFIVAGLVGLWGVAPYEVANRAVAALRSIPASGAETLLPTALTHGLNEDQAWGWYLTSTKMVAYGVCVFLLAPLAVSPVFLYAWTGEMGYVARGVFIALCVGTVASLLALPAATLAQAARRPDFQGRSALLAILLNVPLSLLLVVNWGLLGAAIGTATAMVAGAFQLMASVHRHFGKPLRGTFKLLAQFWPLVLVSALWGVVTWVLFSSWFAALEPSLRFSRATRLYPGGVAVLSYGLCLGTLITVELLRGRLSSAQQAFFRRFLRT